MKLLNDATSPFGRKVLVSALERDVVIVEEFVDVYSAGALDQANSLRQIPTLVTDGGSAIFDSSVILLFLDTLHGDEPLVPDGDRWGVLSRVSLGDGLMEAVLQRVMELKRPPSERSASFVEKLERRIERVLAKIDSLVEERANGTLTADQITLACALGYVDFRYEVDWRKTFPRAGRWVTQIEDRESMKLTVPTRTRPVVVGARAEPSA